MVKDGDVYVREEKCDWLKEADRIIATDDNHWRLRFAAWEQDQSLPWPMPIGHLMFANPKVYGIVAA
jgi:hypothetical protein